MNRRRTLLVFAREPLAGRVKTRLIPRLGADGACRLYEGLLSDTARACAAFSGAVVWWVDFSTPREQSFPFGECRRQPQGDLGERLTIAFALAFSEGAEQAAAIGTDCPELETAHLDALFAALDAGADAAVIPALDGGYAALALARRCDEAFRDIEWSSPRTLSDTLARLTRAGMHVAKLPPVADLDEPADLDALLARLRASPSPACPQTRRALEELGMLSGGPVQLRGKREKFR